MFVDTPGIHKAKNKLGEYMVNIAERSLNEVDVVLWLVEPSNFIGAGEKHIIEQLKKVKTPVILVINKIDMVKREEILAVLEPLLLIRIEKNMILQRSFRFLQGQEIIRMSL